MQQAPSKDQNPGSHPNGVPPGFLRTGEDRRTGPAVDPLEAVLRLERGHKLGGIAGWFVAALCLQGGFGVWLSVAPLVGILGWAQIVQATVRDRLTQEVDIVVEKPEEPPPPPPEPEKEPEPPPPPPVAAPPPQAAPEKAPPQAPAAAQAAAALTANPDPNEPADLTNTIITGNANTYAGGSTMANGTGTKAVTGPVAAQGAPTGTGTATAPAAPKVSKARAASVANKGDWHCPFPAEADVAQVDDALVTVELSVRADGAPQGARALSNPGYGFPRAAVACAMRERYNPAFDADGNPIPSQLRIVVRFERF